MMGRYDMFVCRVNETNFMASSVAPRSVEAGSVKDRCGGDAQVRQGSRIESPQDRLDPPRKHNHSPLLMLLHKHRISIYYYYSLRYFLKVENLLFFRWFLFYRSCNIYAEHIICGIIYNIKLYIRDTSLELYSITL